MQRGWRPCHVCLAKVRPQKACPDCGHPLCPTCTCVPSKYVRADDLITAAPGVSHDLASPASKTSSRTLKRQPSKLDLNPFVIADRLTGAKSGQRPTIEQDAEPTRYSTMSLCIPNHDDLGLHLEHPVPEKPEHGLVRETGNRQSQPRVPIGTFPVGEQSSTRDRTLRRRSTFHQDSGFRSAGIVTTAPTEKRYEDPAMRKAYEHAEEVPGPLLPSGLLAADREQKRAYHHNIQPEGDEGTPGKPPERTIPFRRASRKQSSPGLKSLGRSGHELTTKQPESGRSTVFYADANQYMSQNRALSPLIASGQEQQTELLNSLEDRLTKVSTRSSAHEHAPAYDTASNDQRSVRHAEARSHQRPIPAQASQIDYRAGLKHHSPTTRNQLQKMPSSPAILRRAPALANDHSRHRSPSLTGACGYCELEEASTRASSRAAPARAAIAAIPEVPTSRDNNNNSNNSPRESYHTAEESYTSSSRRSLRRSIRETKANLLRGGSSSVITARPSLAPPPPSSSAGTVTPTMGCTVGTSPPPSPQPEVQPSVPVVGSPSDHDCE